jgi:peptide chain release factor 1
MYKKLEEVENRYEQVNMQLQEPGVANELSRYKSLMKELSGLEDIVTKFRAFKKVQKQLQDNKLILEEERDEEIRQMAKEEISELEKETVRLEEELKIALLPKDPNDDKNVILEIRSGAGGDEASLFAEELFRGYTLFANERGWKFEPLSTSPGNVGGYREAIASISGEKVYSLLKFESGVHRVQRVPKTESQGRVHTSTVTVAVIPEAEEIDIKIDPKDIRVDVFRSGGSGGQSVNTTDSAVRVTHIPTNTVVSCQDGKSQLGNKEKALKVLYSRLLAAEEEKRMKEASKERLSQIGTGDRSERIRTYNFPQSRVTDHRIGLTTQRLADIMQGNFQFVIEPLVTHFQAEALKQRQEH